MNTTSAPLQVIYVIRHGEKPPYPPPDAVRPPPPPGSPFGVDFDGDQNPHSLIPRGWQRSGALTVLFDPTLGFLQAGLQPPASLFSPSYGAPAKTQEHRTYQTIQGLAGRLGLQINSPFAEGQESDLASSIVSNSSRVVLICWEHNHIPALASAFPLVSNTAIPRPWPGDRFDAVWTFTIAEGTRLTQYVFGQIPQQLLSGDSDTVIAPT